MKFLCGIGNALKNYIMMLCFLLLDGFLLFLSLSNNNHHGHLAER